ncbi:MAG: cytochrome c [Alphaproteobacteria bacterium]|nr:cytochrome c [Alphaproteobacteria bacterium]NNF25225.1 cytochrome c [Paracoccaceae bacterium]
MSITRNILALSLGAAVIAGAAFADSHAANPAVKARQSHMQLYSFNLGILGTMAKGETEYDAEAASAAATNLATLAQLNQSAYWPQGTDNASMEGTRALPAIWNDFPDILTKSKAMVDAAVALEASAGDGLEALQAGIGPVGGACGGCHKPYRQSNN